MLSSPELKAVLSTLTQRRAWLLKTLESSADTDDPQREEHLQTLKLLDSAMQKLARTSNSKPASSSPAPTPAAANPRPSAKPHRSQIEPHEAYVLIAEDDTSCAEMLKEALLDMGIKKIEVVEDGRAAMYALQNCSPAFDIVLCDLEMPEMNGLQVRSSVRSLAKLRDTYFVMVTGITEVARIREAISLGIHDYVAKPVDLTVLERKITEILKGDGKSAAKSDA